MSQKREFEKDTIENKHKHKKIKEHKEEQYNHIETIIDKEPKLNENIIINKYVKEYNKEDCYSDGEPINRCIECGVDMGACNPRQYCGKWKCNDYGYKDDSEDDKTQ